jgi:hypothetical protein
MVAESVLTPAAGPAASSAGTPVPSGANPPPPAAPAAAMPPVHRGALSLPPSAAAPSVVSPAPISASDMEAELTRLRNALARCQAELKSERTHNGVCDRIHVASDEIPPPGSDRISSLNACAWQPQSRR